MSKYSEAYRNNIHPRLLFGPEDLPRLKARARDGVCGRMLAEIERRAARGEAYLQKCPSDPLQARAYVTGGMNSDDGSNFDQALHCIAFAGAWTGNRRWLEAGERLLQIVSSGAQPGEGLVLTTMECDVPLAYDLLYDSLAPATRAQVAGYLRRYAVELYQSEVLAKPGSYIWGLGTNTFLHQFEHYVFALGAIFDPERDGAAMEECASLLRRSLHLGIDDGGAIGEGSSYGWGDAEWISTIAVIIRNAGVADLWRDEPHLAAMIRHWAYLVLPGGYGQNTIGDAWRYAGKRPLWSHLIWARLADEPVFQWVWEQMGGRGTIAKIGTAPERFAPDPGFALIWEDDGARSRAPGEACWPTAKTSGAYGVTVMRSDWKPDALYFSLMASGRTPGCHIHQHVDGGHFSLFALGESFSIDSGYGDILGRYHSVMMPEGKEPSGAPNGFGTTRDGGYTAAFAAGRQADYVKVDITPQWDCVWNYRHALLVRAPGAEPYVIILDNVNYRNDYARFLWLVNSEPGNRILLDEAAVRATIQGKTNRLEIVWSYPQANDYPKPHRIELEADEIDSFPLEHRKIDIDYTVGLPGKARPAGGGRWGAGVRPRLKANLLGYNGLLLSALLPRRREQPAATVERLGAPYHFGMRIDHGNVTDTIVASPIDRRLNLAGFEGEAALAIIRRGRDGKLLWWAAADACAFSLEGQSLLPRRGMPVALQEG